MDIVHFNGRSRKRLAKAQPHSVLDELHGDPTAAYTLDPDFENSGPSMVRIAPGVIAMQSMDGIPVLSLA